jgi:uncharacterized protein
MKSRLLLVLLLATGCVTIDERHFFHGEKTSGDASTWTLPAGLSARDVTLTASDGTRLRATRVVREGAKAEVLYFGGDSFHIDQWGVYLARAMTGLPVNVTMIDYRGYGRSEGTTSLAALRDDALLAFDHIRGQTRLPIIVHGFSLGSFVAAHLATQRPADALVLESTATNPQDWVDLSKPWYVRVTIAPPLMSTGNVEPVRSYRGKLLLLAGGADRVTPAVMSQRLIEASASSWKRLVVVPKATHGDVMEHAEAIDAYRDLVAAVGP